MIYRAQFWVRHVGRADVIINASAGSAHQLAATAIADAINLLNRKWPGNRQSDLHLVGVEPVK